MHKQQMGNCVVLCGLLGVSKQLATFVFGFLFLSGAIFLFALSSPVILFRFVVARVAKWVRPDLGEMVGSTGNIFSADLLSTRSPRCSIIVTFLLEGNLTGEESHLLFSRLVTLKNESTGKLFYPEMIQYIEKWCGFAFWKDDPTFDPKNHLITYVPEDPKKSVSYDEMTRFTEHLLNKPFTPGRSPWEIHIVNNYEAPDVSCEGPKTLCLFRIHHMAADGYSIIFALVEGVLQIPIKNINLPNPNYFKRKGLSQYLATLLFPLRLFKDVSNYFIRGLRKSPLNIPDSEKNWKQIYQRTRPVPIERIKEIKGKLNVSFTSVLLAAVSASLSRVLKAKMGRKGDGKLEGAERAAFFIPLPLPGHPKTLKNHVTGAQIDLPLGDYSDPKMRVYECERLLQEQKSSTIPWLLIFLGRTLGLYPSSMSAHITANRVNIAGLTSFPAGSEVMRLGLGDRRLLAVEAAAGCLTGISGVGFMAISYHKQMRFAVTAETAALTRQEVQDLLNLLVEEIDLLYDILKKTD